MLVFAEDSDRVDAQIYEQNKIWLERLPCLLEISKRTAYKMDCGLVAG